jgi:thymidylate synthase (FAD)
MREVTPEVFVVGATEALPGMDDYLRTIKAVVGDDDDWKTDAASFGDKLTEAAGRLCYRSWMPWNPKKPDASNPNVVAVREGNVVYVGNILKQGHGSVLEHVQVNVIFHNVSRVFTHEIVRHRAGCGFSQESLRFVRLNDIKFWVPGSVRALGGAAVDLIVSTVVFLEGVQLKLAEMAGVDTLSFSHKKKLTSMFRRVAPIGLATTIMVSANLRAWRHIINMRTAGGAEEEMHLVIPPLARWLKGAYPACFQDMEEQGDGSYKFALAPKV